MTPSNPQRPTVATLNARVDDHEKRLEEHEARLDKYDAIIVRLDVLIDVLTKHVDHIEAKADTAIDSQKVIDLRNEGMHRWSTIAWAVGTSAVVGVLCFLLGYIVTH